MIFEPVAGYKLTNETNTVTFAKDNAGRFLISDWNANKQWFTNTPGARKVWKMYAAKGYKRA